MNFVLIIKGTVILVVTFCSMSLLRRIMKRQIPQKTTITEKTQEVKNGETSQTSNKSESDSTVDESAYEEESDRKNLLNEDYRRKRRKLNAMLQKHGLKESQLERKQNDILQMEAEIQELSRMIRVNEISQEALKEENKLRKSHMRSLCKQIPGDVEKFAKRKEPAYFRKYSNIKTVDDAKNLMDNICQRRKALTNLELLTFKKFLDLSHELKLKSLKKKPVIPNKPNFDVVFQAIRDKLSANTVNTNTNQPTSDGDSPQRSSVHLPATSPPQFGSFDNPAFESTPV